MLAFLLLLPFVSGDIPVNCNYLQILGSWTLHLNSKTFTSSISDPVSTCGHGQPDQVSAIPLGESWSFPSEDLYRVSLIEPNLVASQAWGGGTWTMVANEGFLMNFPGITLFMYSMYTQDQDTGDIYSECDKTMIGWYSPSDPTDHHDWGCVYGVKDGSNGSSRKLFQSGGKFWVSPTTFLQSTTEKHYEDHHDLIAHINGAQNEWKAGVNEYFVGMSMTEVNSRVGVKRSLKSDKNEAPPPSYTSLLETSKKSSLSPEQLKKLSQTDYESLRAFLKTPLDDIPLDALPKEWDWSSIDGRSYVSDRVINQGDCGSCYAISTIEMLESRLRLLSHKYQDVRLSLQHVVSCGFYTEGCHGGFPILTLKFISEFGIPDESCLEYSAIDSNCADTCEDADLWVTVDDYGYLGGYYGATTEELMMKELRARGPFAVSFEPGFQFPFYVGGIYEEIANRDDSDETMRDTNVPWEQVDHSVLLVGWGEENGKPYWKILNSWGQGWGEGGFFRMRRGKDESSIGSMGEVAMPRVIEGPIE